MVLYVLVVSQQGTQTIEHNENVCTYKPTPYVYTYSICAYIYIYIYVYIERERERERKSI